MLSSYPGSSRIAFEYHIDCLAWVQLHPDRVELEHGAAGILGCLGAVVLGLARSKSLLSQAFLAQLVRGTELFVHPKQLLDPTSLIGQLEAVVISVQAGKEKAGRERTHLGDVLFSSTPLGFTPLEVF